MKKSAISDDRATAAPPAKELRDMYIVLELSVLDVARSYGVSVGKIRKWLSNAGVKVRSPAERARVAAPKISAALRGIVFSEEWKKNISAAGLRHGAKHARGVRTKPSGYIEYTTGPHKGRAVHRVLIEARIGRPLLPKEVVYHRDGNLANNVDDNLELMTRSEHMKLRRAEEMTRGTGRCIINWQQARKIRRLYFDEMLDKRALSERFGLCTKQINEILRGKAWRDDSPDSRSDDKARQRAEPDAERRARAFKVDVNKKSKSDITHRVCAGACRRMRSVRQFAGENLICAQCVRRTSKS